MTRKKRINTRKSKSSSVDITTVVLVGMLLIIGLVMVFDASVVESYYQFNDKFHFVKLQATWMLISIAIMTLAAITPLKLLHQISQPIFVFCTLLLVAVLIPGLGVKIKGAQRWLNLGFVTIQPSELVKLAAIIYFPSWLLQHQRLRSFLTVTGITAGLLMLEPDLGTTIIICVIALSMYFASGASLKKIGLVISIAIVGVTTLVVTSPYRRARLQTFLDPSSDPLGSSYHIRQVLISLGSGGIAGTGIGKSRQKYQYLPEATSDSIFAVLAEEAGFIGSTAVILLFLLLVIHTFNYIPKIEDQYAKLLATGAITWIACQTLLNLGAMVALIPLTGVPLPFISYGGSSLVTVMAAIGLLLNTSRQIKA